MTRLYLGRQAPTYTPPTIRGAWDDTAQAALGTITTVKLGGNNVTSKTFTTPASGPNYDVLIYRGVSGPMSGQTLTGNFDVVIGVAETLNYDYAFHIHVYVTVGDSDTVRGTLINDYTETLANEWPTSATAVALAAPQAYGALAVQGGDRIVAEIGIVSLTGAGIGSGAIRIGTSTGASAGVPGAQVAALVVGSGIGLVNGRAAYLSFSNDIVFQSNGAEGWHGVNTTSASSTVGGSVSLSLTWPPGEDTDMMIGAISHKGAGYGVWPAGWNLIARDIEPVSGIRGEVYYKRQDGETGDAYLVTGLADTATGFTRNYQGGVLSGSPVDVAITRANTGTATGAGTFTPTVPNALLLLFGMAELNVAMTSPQIVTRETGSATLIANGGTATGSDCRITGGDAVLVYPQAVTSTSWTSGSARGSVGIAMALIPETTMPAQAGTRYYMERKSPDVRDWADAPFVGDWTRSRDSTQYTGLGNGSRTEVLGQNKAGGGTWADFISSTDQPGDYILHTRFITPLLDAQTIDGTFDLLVMTLASMNDNAHFPLNTPKFRWHIHAYITVGDTATVRHTLLDNFTDPTDFPVTLASVGLTTPATFTSGACLAGDRVVIEVGFYVRVCPTIAPTYPPECWAYARFLGIGTRQTSGRAVPWRDVVAGETLVLGPLAWLQFSHVFVEQAPAAGPTNISFGTAKTIPSLPYTESPYATTNAQAPLRAVYYVYVAAQTERVFFYCHGSNYFNEPRVFKAPNLTSPDFAGQVYVAGDLSAGRSDCVTCMDLIQGETYYIEVPSTLGAQGKSCGGAVRLNASAYSPPQEDDLYVPAANLYVYRDGWIINCNPVTRNDQATGIDLDFSGTAIPDFNNPAYPTPTHTGPRLYAGLHEFQLVIIFDAVTLNVNEFETNYIGDVFDAPAPPDEGLFHISTLHLPRDGSLIIGCFGNGYQLVNGADDLDLAAYLNYPSNNFGYPSAIRETSQFALEDEGFPQSVAYLADVDRVAPWHVAGRQGDEDVIYYVSGGWYFPTSLIDSVPYDTRTTFIKRYSRSSGQLTDFATVPLHPGLHEGLYGMAIHPDGDVLVCNGNYIDRLNSSGVVVQSYTGSDAAKCHKMIDIVYTANGQNFWAFDQGTATLWLFRVSDGAILQQVDTYAYPNLTTQIAIYQPTGITPGPPTPVGAAACPAPSIIAVIGQNACPTPSPSAN